MGLLTWEGREGLVLAAEIVDVPVGPIVTEEVVVPVLLAPMDPVAVPVSVGVPVPVAVPVAVPVPVPMPVAVPETARDREMVELKDLLTVGEKTLDRVGVAVRVAVPLPLIARVRVAVPLPLIARVRVAVPLPLTARVRVGVSVGVENTLRTKRARVNNLISIRCGVILRNAD
jgi:hypothetical protein